MNGRDAMRKAGYIVQRRAIGGRAWWLWCAPGRGRAPFATEEAAWADAEAAFLRECARAIELVEILGEGLLA